jgi:hypothetical protein
MRKSDTSPKRESGHMTPSRGRDSLSGTRDKARLRYRQDLVQSFGDVSVVLLSLRQLRLSIACTLPRRALDIRDGDRTLPVRRDRAERRVAGKSLNVGE